MMHLLNKTPLRGKSSINNENTVQVSLHLGHDQHLVLRVSLQYHLFSTHTQNEWILAERKSPIVDKKNM